MFHDDFEKIRKKALELFHDSSRVFIIIHFLSPVFLVPFTHHTSVIILSSLLPYYFYDMMQYVNEGTVRSAYVSHRQWRLLKEVYALRYCKELNGWHKASGSPGTYFGTTITA